MTFLRKLRKAFFPNGYLDQVPNVKEGTLKVSTAELATSIRWCDKTQQYVTTHHVPRFLESRNAP